MGLFRGRLDVWPQAGPKSPAGAHSRDYITHLVTAEVITPHVQLANGSTVIASSHPDVFEGGQLTIVLLCKHDARRAFSKSLFDG
jgi:hypothetical protein